MQLVLSGKRVIAHGGEYLPTGGTVINLDTGVVYQNATVAECDNCPSDIGEVGYEYHAGEFIPCAPFGKGDGNIAVLCGEDCKVIKDSGLSLSDVKKIFYTTYNGAGHSSCSVTCGFKPKFIVIRGYKPEVNDGFAQYECVISTEINELTVLDYTRSRTLSIGGSYIGSVECKINETGANWYDLEDYVPSKNPLVAMNQSGVYYSVLVIG